jgi:hypothetical protein
VPDEELIMKIEEVRHIASKARQKKKLDEEKKRIEADKQNLLSLRKHIDGRIKNAAYGGENSVNTVIESCDVIYVEKLKEIYKDFNPSFHETDDGGLLTLSWE